MKPIFDHYLRITEIPELELKVGKNADGNVLTYRWKANAEGFAMPISFQMGSDEQKWIYPNTDWQQLELGNDRISNLNFHTNRFYVNIVKD